MRFSVLAVGLLAAASVGGCQQQAASPAAPAASASASASPAASASASAMGASDAMTADAFGPVRVGMTEAEALAALGAGWRAEPGSNESCRFIGQGGDGAAMRQYMVRGDRVVGARADDYAPTAGRSTVVTDRGVGLGSTAQQVVAAYPTGLTIARAEISDHTATLTTAAVNGRAVRFLTNSDNVVVSVAAGEPAVFSIDGCG